MHTQQKNGVCSAGAKQYATKFDELKNAIAVARDINTIQLGLRSRILEVYDAEMATVYFVGSSKRELISWLLLPGDCLKTIRIPINRRSIAGFVAQTRKPISVSDVYNEAELSGIDADLAFDATWDRKTGRLTRQVLAMPILVNNSLLGVTQLINKRHGAGFTEEDHKLFGNFSKTLAVAIQKQQKLATKPGSRFDLLIRKGVITGKELVKAEALARQSRQDIETTLLKEFKVPRKVMVDAWSQFYGVAFEDLARATCDPVALFAGRNIEYFRKARCAPLTKAGDKAVLAIDDPHDTARIDEVKQVLKSPELEVRVSFRADIEQFIRRGKPDSTPVASTIAEKNFRDILEEMKNQEGNAPATEEAVEKDLFHDSVIVQLVREIIEYAHKVNASDIHIEPYGVIQDAEVRFRVDGHCAKVLTIPKNHIRAVVSRLKILANLDISEKRKPQDGKIKFRTGAGKEIELRIATIPTADGNEDVVMRLLADSEPLPLNEIMPRSAFNRFGQIIQKPYGIVLVVGPTGSGKTTTLHSALGYINTPEKKIWTAEDPVEITQYRLRQVQVNPKIGLTFAAAMRAFLRADPDVIMVGEMRDHETTAMGIEASLTGHLVFSTLHTNSAPETIIRLIDMGIDPFSFADALLGILAQRLVSRLCPECRITYHPQQNEYERIKQMYGGLFDQHIGVSYSDDLCFYKPVGCESCSYSGYKGRMGLYELLIGSEALRKLIVDKARVDTIRHVAMQEGMTTLLQEGIRQVFLGHTDLKQVVSVCSY